MQPSLPGAAHDERGQVLPWVVVMIVVIVAIAGMVIDLGNAYRVHQQLQATADAAAAAGADNLPSTPNAIAAAARYSAAAGGKNSIRGAGPVAESAYTDCSTDPAHCKGANTVHVTETASVPTTFLGLLGIDHIDQTVQAQACSPCGGVPLDVMIVLDRTGSMQGAKLTHAQEGIRSFLTSMDPNLDNVGLVVLPPAPSLSQACGPAATYADSTPAYLLVPLTNTYATKLGQLNPSSQLVSTVDCVQAGGSTAYAMALDIAQSELDKDGRPNVQDVIIILSDGAANDGPRYLPPTSPYRTNPCRQADAIAGASKARNVLMYSIGYDLGGAGADWCYAGPGAVVNGQNVGGQKEQPPIHAWEALSAIASPGNYYSEPDPTSLVGIFDAISADIAAGTSRLNG